MNKPIISFICILFLFQLVFSCISMAYKPAMHMKITEYAVTKSGGIAYAMQEIGLVQAGEKLEEVDLKGQKLHEWIQHGSDWEDVMAVRYYWHDSARGVLYNHFYNPLNNLGYVDNFGKGQSLVERIHDSEVDIFDHLLNEWSYEMAKKLYYTALTGNTDVIRNHVISMRDGKELFDPSIPQIADFNLEERKKFYAWTLQALGHTLHLIQDAAVPAHTRNDLHVNEPYEKWTMEKIGYLNDKYDFTTLDGSDPWGYWKQYPNIPVPDTFIDTDQLNEDSTAPVSGPNQGLSEYSHANFFSRDTIFRFNLPRTPAWTGDVPSYSDVDYVFDSKPINGKERIFVYLTKQNEGGVKHLALCGIFHPKMSGSEIWEPEWYNVGYTVDDAAVHEDYAQKLIPRAVGYSAGMIDYFFRGKMDVEIANGQATITNRSEETMENGHFELYYDTPDKVSNVVSGLLNAVILSPLPPGGSQKITFTVPSDLYGCGSGTKLTVVFKGTLGNEQDAIIGKVVNISPDCVVIKAGDNTGAQYFTVWDPANNALAEISDPVTGDAIFFPAEYADISNWLTEHSMSVGTQAYKWEMENNALKRIGQSWQDIDLCECTVDRSIETSCTSYEPGPIFSHPGCGDFRSYCDYSQTLSTENGSDVWDTMSEGRVYVDKNFWESILGSYAPLVNTSVGKDEPACLRSEWSQLQTVHSYFPEDSLVPYNEWDITQPIRWTTPIGAMDLPSESYLGTDDFYSIYNCPSTTTWSLWHRNPPFDGDPIAKPIIYASYSDRVMVQLYFVSSVQWSGLQQEDEFLVNNARECQVTAYEENYATNNSLVAACTMNQDGAASLDPRTQPRNPEFENAVRSLVDHTISMQKAAGEITDKEVFKGGINIYIASKTGDGAGGLLKLINDARASQGLYPLLPDNNLNSAAQMHAKDMALNLTLSHTGSDGSTIQDRVNKTGYAYIVKPGGSSGASEYIANGLSTVDDIFTKFRISASWDTLMNSGYHEMGIGSEIGADGRRYWCLTFGFNDEH